MTLRRMHVTYVMLCNFKKIYSEISNDLKHNQCLNHELIKLIENSFS